MIVQHHAVLRNHFVEFQIKSFHENIFFFLKKHFSFYLKKLKYPSLKNNNQKLLCQQWIVTETLLFEPAFSAFFRRNIWNWSNGILPETMEFVQYFLEKALHSSVISLSSGFSTGDTLWLITTDSVAGIIKCHSEGLLNKIFNYIFFSNTAM